MASEKTISLRRGKGLIFAAAVGAAVILAAVINIGAFFESGKLLAYDAFKFLTAAALMCLTLIVKINLGAAARRIVSVVIFALGPTVCFEAVRELAGSPVYQPVIYFEYLVFYVLIQLVAFGLTQSVFASVCIEFGLAFSAHAADRIVMMIRGTPLVPTDLFAIDTAMNVTSPDQWHLSPEMLTALAAMTAYAAFAKSFPLGWRKKLSSYLARPAAAVCSLALAGLCAGYIWNIDYDSFSTSTFNTEATNDLNGIALNFYISARKMRYDEPVGYSAETLENFLSSYEDEAPPEELSDLPNIIVIMNESFSDLSYLGRLKTDVDYMPNYDELSDEYLSGKLLVSTLGGGTCNTEFEFLTGLSMMYLPSGSYSYMQQITREIPSMASYLEQYGYETVAMHPFYEVSWKRNSVYELMGFDDFISAEDMTGSDSKFTSDKIWEKNFGSEPEYVRNYISDEWFYEQVIEQFENKSSERIFIFGVTVQNHSGYEYEGDDFTTDVHIEDSEGKYPRAEQFLSLMKISDEALASLIEYFEGVDERTMIVFFGDHQPAVEQELIDELSPNLNLIVNNFLTRYQTPYMIWSNFELDYEQEPGLGVTSPNFLGVTTLEAAGIPLSREYQMIRDVQNVTPAMNAFGYYDRFGAWYDRASRYDEPILNVYGFYTYHTLTGG